MASGVNLAIGAAARTYLLTNPYNYGFAAKGAPFIGRQLFGKGFAFDLVMNEAYDRTAQVTDHAVQKGYNVTDHIHFNLMTGSLLGKVSNHSVNAALSDPTGLVAGDRFKDMYNNAIALYEAGQAVTLYGVMGKVEDVILTGVSMSRDGDSGLAQEFEMSFKKVNVVKLDTVGVETYLSLNDMTTSDNRQASKLLNMGAS